MIFLKKVVIINERMNEDPPFRLSLLKTPEDFTKWILTKNSTICSSVLDCLTKHEVDGPCIRILKPDHWKEIFEDVPQSDVWASNLVTVILSNQLYLEKLAYKDLFNLINFEESISSGTRGLV